MEVQFSGLTKKERKILRKQMKMEEKQKQASKKNILNTLFWVLGITAVIVTFIGLGQYIRSSLKVVQTIEGLHADDWYKGNKEAKVSIIEYSDFQCPACANFAPALHSLSEEYRDQAVFIYRHFPLPQHKNALLAAKVAEAAGKQGKFWEMHDMLFARQTSWESETNPQQIFTSYAKELGLDEKTLLADINVPQTLQKIQSDQKSGELGGVNATPTLFLNGKKVDNIQNIADLKKKIEEELKREK